MKIAAMLWTGGKDSALALYEAAQEGYRVQCLVTFAPPNPDFLAHPLPFLKLQAQALNLPHHIIPIVAPFEKSYEDALRSLRENRGIDTVITGDIDLVNNAPNWIRERSRPVGMNVHTPLWARERKTLLEQLLAFGFKIRFSCVDTRFLPAAWAGRQLDQPALAELIRIRHSNGLDLCGENGEYHTLTTNAPNFTRSIAIPSHTTGTAGALVCMQIQESKLVPK